MKKFSILLIAASGLLYASGLELEVGYKTSAFDYAETYEGILLDTEDSDYGEIEGAYIDVNVNIYRNRYGQSDQLQLYMSHTEGQTRYVGALLGSGDPYGSYVSTTQNTYDDRSLSYRFNVDRPGGRYALFLGLGSYEWERELSAIQKENYRWSYTRMGFSIGQDIGRNVELGFDAEVQYALDPEVEAYIPDIGRRVTFQLGDTYTYKFAFPLTFRMDGGLAFTARLEYEYVSIEQSEILYGYLEPDSEQKNWHIYTGMVFAF